MTHKHWAILQRKRRDGDGDGDDVEKEGKEDGVRKGCELPFLLAHLYKKLKAY